MKKFEKYFYYDEKREKKLNKKITRKAIISMVLYGIGLVGFDFFLSGSSILDAIFMSFMLIDFLFTLYYGMQWQLNKTMDALVSGSTIYAIDKKENIFKIKLKINKAFYSNISKTLAPALDSKVVAVSKAASAILDVKKQEKELEKKEKKCLENLLESLEEEDIAIYEYPNIYKVQDKKNYIECVCDEVDIKSNEWKKKEKLVIYKYYDNVEELIKIIKKNKKKEKKVLQKEKIHKEEKQNWIRKMAEIATDEVRNDCISWPIVATPVFMLIALIKQDLLISVASSVIMLGFIYMGWIYNQYLTHPKKYVNKLFTIYSVVCIIVPIITFIQTLIK